MARKYVRVNYFEVKLVPARELLKSSKNDYDLTFESAALWDMKNILDFLEAKRESYNTNIRIGDEYAEVENDSHIYVSRYRVYGFQLSKLRETNIPAKKKIGKIKEEIMLDDDEYIGEFNTILYDEQYHTLMVQSNLYGLSTIQLEQYLTELRLKYLEEIGTPDDPDDILMVKLTPILDHSKLESALNAEYYRKIKVKASDVSLDATLNGNSVISDARRTLLEYRGANIEITVSIGQGQKTASLDEERVRETLKEFRDMNGKERPTFELSVKEDEDSPVEIINLIEPRMTDRISVEVEPRKSIAHEYMFNLMLEKYKSRKRDVRRILGIIE